MSTALIVLVCLTLLAAVAVPWFLHLRAQARLREQTDRLLSRLDQNLGAATKLLEVRAYYEETAAAYKRMLDEAYKEGNRFRQDQMRKLMERLETLKARAVDKQVRILDEPEGGAPVKKRRRRGGRRFHPRSEQRPGDRGDNRTPGQHPPEPPAPPSPKPPAQG